MEKERKKIKEWLEELPEPSRKKALENLNKFEKFTPHYMESRPTCIADALLIAFPWSKTPEGWDYWDNLRNKL